MTPPASRPLADLLLEYGALVMQGREHDADKQAAWLAARGVTVAASRAAPEPHQTDHRLAKIEQHVATMSHFEWCPRARADYAGCTCGLGGLQAIVMEAARESVGAVPAGPAPTEPMIEAAAVLRKALMNVSVHSAHLPGVSPILLSALLTRCGEIARAALRAASPKEPTK